MKTVYLSGPMRGLPDLNFPAFLKAAKLLRSYGYEVFNPAEHDLEMGWVRAEYAAGDGSWNQCVWATKGPPCPGIKDNLHRFIEDPSFDLEEGLAWDLDAIRRSEGVVVLPNYENSVGTNLELTYARAIGRPIYYLEWAPEHSGGFELVGERFKNEIEEHRRLIEKEKPVSLPLSVTAKTLRTPEQHEVMGVFIDLLMAATGDGGAKRAAGTKPSWKVDEGHEGAIFSHITKWKRGEKVDPDSGVHPLVHAAWRCLAIAAQEAAVNGLIPEAPAGATLDYPEA